MHLTETISETIHNVTLIVTKDGALTITETIEGVTFSTTATLALRLFWMRPDVDVWLNALEIAAGKEANERRQTTRIL